MSSKLRVLMVGIGNMGLSHARAYDRLESFEIAAICTRRRRSEDELPSFLRGTTQFDDYAAALRDVAPDCVCICSWPDTHAAFALQALDQGAHVFIEKPLATSVAAAEQVVAAARSAERELYELHPGRVVTQDIADHELAFCRACGHCLAFVYLGMFPGTAAC